MTEMLDFSGSLLPDATSGTGGMVALGKSNPLPLPPEMLDAFRYRLFAIHYPQSD